MCCRPWMLVCLVGSDLRTAFGTKVKAGASGRQKVKNKLRTGVVEIDRGKVIPTFKTLLHRPPKLMSEWMNPHPAPRKRKGKGEPPNSRRRPRSDPSMSVHGGIAECAGRPARSRWCKS